MVNTYQTSESDSIVIPAGKTDAGIRVGTAHQQDPPGEADAKPDDLVLLSLEYYADKAISDTVACTPEQAHILGLALIEMAKRVGFTESAAGSPAPR